MGERPWLTIALLVSMLAVYGASWGVAGWPLAGGGAVPSATLEAFGGLAPARLWIDGQWWRLLTHAWVHGAAWHVGLNAWALWLLGVWLEPAIGRAAFAVLFGVSVLWGGALTAAMPEGALMVGASGGIYGLGGFALVRGGFGPKLAGTPTVGLGSLAFWLGVGLVLGLAVDGVSFAGHFGGALAGASFAGLGAVGAEPARDSDRGKRAPLRWLSVLVLLGGSAALVRFAAHPWNATKADAMLGFGYLDGGQPSKAIGPLSRAIQRSEEEDASWLNALAYALALEDRELARARRLADRALELKPGDPNILDTVGWVACLQGRTEEGQGVLREALEGDPELAEAELHLDRCLSPRD